MTNRFIAPNKPFGEQFAVANRMNDVSPCDDDMPVFIYLIDGAGYKSIKALGGFQYNNPYSNNIII